MADPFEGHAPTLSAPCERQAAITPGEAALDPRPRVLVALTDGDVTVRDQAGVEVTYPVTAGAILPFRAIAVPAATASVVGWW